ncbi:hypothetical protein MPTK1_4g23700 [Marchantia polymorpha subsp. ruderalis]|uniref:J domain-containing protein n=2 Tax=Marchantia polymorpha TaxID=3197 RepID=A0AAF6BD25_MARPO|nr:hypothetical protein MARPO_0020s0133 [Marchantia polymorpha]BBN09909.1 hypothetical protein Mp_4g23700 [Marchantia polymorpha subsp. ruderalis]|eukprot:PTQ44486.1 hypothetical protein MARPO_0020s0133 [Marchantia polymorpha]
MAVALSATTPASGVSQLSSTFLPRTQRLRVSCKPASFKLNVARSARCEVATEEIQEDGVLSVPSLYGLLGIDQDVDLNDIKTAYRQMARLYHPDVCPVSKREECTKMFLQVQDAYEILSDPERRAEYDYHLMHPLSANAYGLGNFMKRNRGPRSREGVSEAWKMQWQAQLSRLDMKARMEQAQAKTSWGAQMRSRTAQN